MSSLTDWTHDGAKYPAFKKSLGERERHAYSGHEKVSDGQVDQEYGQVCFGTMIKQEYQDDNEICNYGSQRRNYVH